MKKLLSLFLALSMIISCVSMVSFVVNAEEAKEPVGVQITATEALTATMAYPRTKANFTAADVAWGDTNDDTSGNTLRQGSITRTFAVFNNSNGKYYGSIGFFGGNRLGIDGETSPNEGWEGLGQKDITLAAGASTTVTATFKVYEFAADGAVVVKVGTSKYGDVVGYAPLSTVYLHVNAYANTEANASVVIMPKAGESTVLFDLPNQGKVTVSKVYEVPSIDFVDNGDAENGSAGWRSWGGGTTTVIEDPDNADNHIVKHVPTGIAHSVSYALEAYVLDAPELFLNGKGIGTYSISFRAKAEAGKGGKFNAMLAGAKNIGSYFTSGKSITLTDEWQTFKVDINVDETVYQTWFANGDSQIGLRLDGTAGAFGTWANPGTPFTYYVDDFTIKHESEISPGIEYSIVTAPSYGYPLWRGTMGLTEADAVNNEIKLSFDFFNTGAADTDVAFMIQDVWTTIPNGGKNLHIAAGYKATAEFTIKTDGNGNAVKDDGTVICALSALTLRFQWNTGKTLAGNKMLVVGNDDLSVKMIKKVVGANHQDTGAEVRGSYSYKLWTDELPAFGTPTPTPTPTPKPIVKGFQLVALKDIIATSGTPNDYPVSGTGKFTAEDVVWSDAAIIPYNQSGFAYDELDKTYLVQMGSITRKYLVFNNGTTAVKAGVTLYGGNRKATASPATGWDCVYGTKGHAGYGDPAMEPQTVKLQTISAPVFKTVDGQIVVKFKTSKMTINGVEVTGYAPISSLQLRFDVWDMVTGSSVVVAPYEVNENDEVFAIYDSAKTTNYTKTKVYEIPNIQFATPTPTPTPTPKSKPIVDYLTYEISNNEIIITDCDESACGAYYVPALIEGYPVTCISASAFEDCNLITEIILPETIKEIDSFAFYGCYSLVEICIPSEVTKINSYTFYNCSSLTTVYLPASITTINSNAFNGCENIEVIYFGGTEEQWSSVSINSGNATIHNATVNYQFNFLLKNLSYDIIANEVVITSCDSLYGGALVIPATIDGYPVTSIGSYAFRSCGGLISIVIPDSVVNIGVSAFESCSALTSITIPDSVTSIGSYAFSYCSSLKEVHITDLTAWCNISFSNYSANPLYYANNLYLNGELVTELVIPDEVTTIKSYAFYKCSSLESVTIPDSVASIGDYAFSGCSSLTSITIPDSVTSIGSYAFSGCSSLTSITIPDSVTSIGSSAFYDCSSLKEVHITNLTAWCNISFSNYSANPLYYANNLYLNGELLTDLVIPEGVTSIGSYAFLGCDSLTRITIPDSVTSIGYEAFYNCSKLNAVYYRGSEAQWNSISIESYNSYLTNATCYYNSCIGSAEHAYDDVCDEQCNLCCFERTALHSYSSFGDLVCDICGVERPHPALQYITYEIVENEVTITDCDTSVSGEFEIPATIDGYPVTSIGEDAFRYCESLTSITIPDSVTNVGRYAFANCSNLTSVTIPESVNEIGYYAFYGSANIKEVHITDIEAWCNITFGNIYYTNPLSYAKKLYLNGELLTDLVIPEGVTSISDYAFRYCESLTSVTIPDSVTSIGASAFECCSGLTSITIQDSITNISDSAFYLCDKLEKVNYFGTQSKWNNITIGQNNTALTSAEISFITCTIEGATVDVGASLTINYFVKFNNIDKVGLTIDDFSMRFTSAIGKIYLVKGVFDAETGYYKYPYTGINPQCMNDNIKAELIYNDEVVAIKEYYSVKEYCERQSSRTASQLKLTLRQYNKLKTLLADMLVYGAASQEYKNYNISNLPDADDWVQNYKSNFIVPGGVRKITGNGDANNKATSVGLNMANVNRIYFKVKITDDAIIKLNDVEIDKSTMIKNADGTYTLYSQDIKATQFSDVFTLTITKDGEEITKVEYNVNAYIQAKHTNTDLAKIVKALSNYGNTASEYAKLFSELDMEFELEEDIL